MKIFHKQYRGSHVLVLCLSLLAGCDPSTAQHSGSGNPSTAFQKIEAEAYDDMSGVGLRAEGQVVSDVSHGDWLLYRDLDFADGARSITVRLAGVNSGGSFELREGSLDGPVLGILAPSPTGSWSKFSVQTFGVSEHAGRYDLYFVGRGGSRIGDLDWFRFDRESAETDREDTDSETEDEQTGGSDDTGTSTTSETDSGTDRTAVAVEGRRLEVNGVPFHVQGVCWHPVAKGHTQETGLDYDGFSQVDVSLMKAAGINTVRTYSLVDSKEVLDRLYQAGIFIINTVYGYGGADVDTAVHRAAGIKNHPAILMWAIGNEWNYNHLYDESLDFPSALKRVGEVAAAMKALDDGHPIATVYGGVPDKQTLERLPDIDVWGINYYNGLSFGNTFALWRSRSSKPMFFAEYGADAYNSTDGFVDLAAQSQAVKTLTQLMMAESSKDNVENVCIGGTIFEWCDEWWKDFTDGNGGPAVHDTGGAAPGGGPYPDAVFNEEYWGIVDIERRPRPAYHALAEIYL